MGVCSMSQGLTRKNGNEILRGYRVVFNLFFFNKRRVFVLGDMNGKVECMEIGAVVEQGGFTK